jgi:hypothetical protein
MYLSVSLQLQVHREIILYGGHNTAYEFQENEDALVDLGLASILYDRVYDCFHHLGVVAGMYARLLQPCVRVVLHRHRLLGVISCNVLEHLVLGQRKIVFRVSRQPQSRCAGVEVVGDA